jgi:hypothetical protein
MTPNPILRVSLAMISGVDLGVVYNCTTISSLASAPAQEVGSAASLAPFFVTSGQMLA